jgi:hypothetical protein
MGQSRIHQDLFSIVTRTPSSIWVAQTLLAIACFAKWQSISIARTSRKVYRWLRFAKWLSISVARGSRADCQLASPGVFASSLIPPLYSLPTACSQSNGCAGMDCACDGSVNGFWQTGSEIRPHRVRLQDFVVAGDWDPGTVATRSRCSRGL